MELIKAKIIQKEKDIDNLREQVEELQKQIQSREDKMLVLEKELINEKAKLPYLYCIELKNSNKTIEVGCWSEHEFADFYIPVHNLIKCDETTFKHCKQRDKTFPFTLNTTYQCQILKKRPSDMDIKTLQHIDLYIPEKQNYKADLFHLYVDFRHGIECVRV